MAPSPQHTQISFQQHDNGLMCGCWTDSQGGWAQFTPSVHGGCLAGPGQGGHPLPAVQTPPYPGPQDLKNTAPMSWNTSTKDCAYPQDPVKGFCPVVPWKCPQKQHGYLKVPSTPVCPILQVLHTRMSQAEVSYTGKLPILK